MKYKITLVEEDILISELIADFLNASEHFEVCYTFSSGESFYHGLEKACKETDLIIIDFQMKDITVESLLNLIQMETVHTPVLVLTSHYSQSLIGYMIKLGVACYLPKCIKLVDFLQILKEVINKGHYISKDQFPYLKEAVCDPASDLTCKSHNISKREVDIIYLLAQQYTAKEIGNRLFLAPKTVENYKNTLFAKTGTRNIVGLVLWALQKRIIPMDKIFYF